MLKTKLSFKELWLKGRQESNSLLNLNVTFKVNLLSTLLSILFVAVLFLPIVLLAIQFVMIYGYIFLSNIILLYLGLFLICLFFIFINALICLVSLIILKCYIKDSEELNSIDFRSFFIYQLINPSFIIFIFVVAFIFGGFI